MSDNINNSKPSVDNLAMFETINGATIVGTLMSVTPIGIESGDILLYRPIKGTLGVNRAGQQGLSWQLWMGEEVALNSGAVMGHLRAEVPENIRNTYIQITTGLSIAPAGGLPKKPNLVS